MALNVSRRRVLQGLAGATAASLLAGIPFIRWARSGPYNHIPCDIKGANASLGHRLLHQDFPEPNQRETCQTVIIGGGIAGLSAARHLTKNNHADFVVLELADAVGGNSVWGASAQNNFPWGAHYLPVPGEEQEYLYDFLEELGIITGYNKGNPLFNEYYLCHDLSERLWINGKWQEGLIPKHGLQATDLQEIEKFFQLMDHFRSLKGNDNHPAFTIPSEKSSQDPNIRVLDLITMARYLDKENLNSPYLRWYVNYCCRDDYGMGIESVSAWAGIHYFTSRRRTKNTTQEADAVLTWPEGNGFLVNGLVSSFKNKIKTGTLVYRVDSVKNGFDVYAYDAPTEQSRVIHCQNVISAVPQFVAARIFKQEICQFPELETYVYAPWVVANIWIDEIAVMPGSSVAWDNVSYYSPSLGYIRSNHQKLGPDMEEILTYYRPLDHLDPASARKEAYHQSPQEWRDIILSDLSHFLPDPELHVQKMEVWLWGHGMIVPTVDHLSRPYPMPQVQNLFFAHSDLSGISIFEEAYWQGMKAAKNILGK